MMHVLSPSLYVFVKFFFVNGISLFPNLIHFFVDPVKIGAWALIIAGCFGAVIYNMILVFVAYFSYDVNVDVKITPNVELLFPAITICNLTPINKEALDQASGVDEVKGIVGASSRRRRRKRSGMSRIILSQIVLLLLLRTVHRYS